LWACAEANPLQYCKCEKKTCSKLHLADKIKAEELTQVAKQFRAKVLNEGFKNFLEKLVSPK
jgi:hypothetical protein